MDTHTTLKQRVRSFPDMAGVYLMKDILGSIIYIGKAKSLRKRVSQYFQDSPKDYKTQRLVSRISDIEIIPTTNEEEALLLEARLIRKNMPHYNIDLRDDKSYPFIRITNEDFPRVNIVRPKADDNAFYYGPYTNVRLLRLALKSIRRIFHFCTCRNPHQSCLYKKINLCPGVYQSKQDRIRYKRDIQNLKLFLDGRYANLLNSLNKVMLSLSGEHRFEEAAALRDQIQAFSNLTKGQELKAIDELAKALKLSVIPKRIEAFDVSNIVGQQASAAMVSFLNGFADKDNYRRFRIKSFTGIDDYKMLQEVINRRYTRVLKEGIEYPDLILIDGGIGQLGAAKKVLDSLKLDIPVVSIAKKEEEIFVVGRKNPIRLSPSSPALLLLRRIRDEAHRFAIKYHHYLRKINLINNEK